MAASGASHGAGAGAAGPTDRLFLAVDLVPESRAAVAEALHAARLPGRPVPVENLHLTIRFLGDTEPHRRDRLVAALERADLGTRFCITLSGAGAFPRPARATTLWIGISQGAGELASLAKHAETAVQEAGYAAENRPFRGHLTIARIRTAADVRPLLRLLSGIAVRSPVDELVLFRSTLGTGAPRYDALARFSL